MAAARRGAGSAEAQSRLGLELELNPGFQVPASSGQVPSTFHRDVRLSESFVAAADRPSTLTLAALRLKSRPRCHSLAGRVLSGQALAGPSHY
jgi:hypothetical protein